MGRLVAGEWTTAWYTPTREGAFVRESAPFRESLGSARFPAQPGRYRLFVSLACPWAHRTLIARSLLQLEQAIAVTVVDPRMTDEGWHFEHPANLTDDGSAYQALGGRELTLPDGRVLIAGTTRVSADHVRFLRDLYTTADPKFTGRVTVPVLWDEVAHTIVCNESSLIVRTLHEHATALRGGSEVATQLAARPVEEVDAMIKANYGPVNDGVYRAGFATQQGAYEAAVKALFQRLDELEQWLAQNAASPTGVESRAPGAGPYLLGEQITEADICLLPTLLRFDSIYHYHFKCNLRKIAEYPRLSRYVRELGQVPEIARTINLEHAKIHYYWSHRSINPHAIVPLGPLDFYDR